jgi:uncharacterized protein YjbK
MIELEYKYLLDKESFNNITNLLNKKYSVKKILQLNYYYDSDDFYFTNNDITFRIRQKEEDLNIEIKTLKSRSGNLNIKNEFKEKINNLPLSFDINKTEWKNILNYNGIINLKGVLITERLICHPSEGIEIDLDKNLYLGQIDYELEIEYEENYKKDVNNVVKELINIDEFESHKGKNGRFFDKFLNIS